MRIPKSNEEVREDMHKDLWEVEQLIPEALGMIVLVIKGDGDIVYRCVFGDGGEFPLLAATLLAQHNMLCAVQEQKDH